MKKKKPKGIWQIGIPLLIILIVVQPSTAHAATVVWEDDFDDGDLEGWELVTYYTPDIGKVGYFKGEVRIKNESKQMFFLNAGNETYHGWNWAERNSTTAYGHWSFDVNTTGGCHSCLFMFIYRDLTPETDFEGLKSDTPIGFESYILFISTTGEQVVLYRIDEDYTFGGGSEDYLIDSIEFDDLGFSPHGVLDIDITRTSNGNITVFVKPTNDKAYTKAMSVIDNTYTKSEQFVIASQYLNKTSRVYTFDIYVDNIRVDNDSSWEPDDWKLPPEPTSAWTPVIVLLAIMTLLIFRKRRKPH
ncbi:MAG: hypothetical protein ACXAC8_19460 [Candidatus Hodarchaeales archaeon]|jgi:hypothetical protein